MQLSSYLLCLQMILIIEKIFIHFGIFKKMGWRTTYTFVLIFIYFFISDKWLELLKKGDTFIQKITLYNMVNFTSINSLFVLEVPRILTFGRGVFHSLKEQLKGEPLYASMMSIIKTWATLNGNISIKMIVFL
ncbi:hypothetical protein J2S74_002213 [Evansella vedderi]|uniref:Uncharacterized protein n=1 Tax=Evansella vedderi TaxID=38282 RepID=A0ABT9ZUB5_9BACI|nr:hypothetical protein [Evansella vedderi]MDQ0254834.1 hypothetical protein [Evansella vedderi]